MRLSIWMRSKKIMTNLSLNISDIYLERNLLIFTNEIKLPLEVILKHFSLRLPISPGTQTRGESSNGKNVRQSNIWHSITSWSPPVWVVPKILKKQKWCAVTNCKNWSYLTVYDKVSLKIERDRWRVSLKGGFEGVSKLRAQNS